MYHYFAIIIFIIVICISCSFVKVHLKNDIYDITKDGFVTNTSLLSPSQVSNIKNLWNNSQYKDIHNIIQNSPEISDFIHSVLPQDYVLLDYIMFLENSVLHTCHRDNNGSRFNTDIDESYTMIIYIDDMNECLDIVPGSHLKSDLGVYLFDKTQTWSCSPGHAILFNANLVHSGSLLSRPNNKRIQLKISRKQDIPKLLYYNNYHKLLNKSNTNSHISKVLQHGLSCQFPIVADLTQGQNKNYIQGNLSHTDKIFSNIMYSKDDYYVLDNAF